MKRIFPTLVFLIHAIILQSLLCGCALSPPESAEEELVRFSWKLEGERGGGLNFEGEKLLFNMEKADGSVLELDEYYEIDSEKIVICSESFGELCFKYRLYGDELELSYEGMNLKFTKLQD